MNQNNINLYLNNAPKAELHIHFEGSIQPSTLILLANKNNISLPHTSLKKLRDWFIFTDFTHFITVYRAITQCLKTKEDYQLATYELGKFFAKQNIKYAEVIFSPASHFKRNIPFEEYFTGLTNGSKQVLKDFNVSIRWIFDIVRNTEEVDKYANYTVDVAIEGKNDGVIALGLGGKEEGHPSKLFSKFFKRAIQNGLHSVPHAGEFTSPSDIWDAVTSLNAERIGHGIQAINDVKLLKYLQKKQIPLEINPSSNICLGRYKSLKDHPLPYFIQSKIPVIIGSDDPALFNNNLNEEFVKISEAFNFNIDIIDSLLVSSIKYSFMSDIQKENFLNIYLGYKSKYSFD